MLGNTFFQLKTWNLPKTLTHPCTEGLFLIENSAANSFPNQSSSTCFVKNFQKFVIKGAYRSEIMGDLCLSPTIIGTAFRNELARYLLLYNKANEEPEYHQQLRKDRRHARRIAVC